MSGFRGTIGSPERDKVAAWIYDRVESMDPKQRKSIFKLVQNMATDRNHLIDIKDKGFREHMAILVKLHFFKCIDKMVDIDIHMATRLRNLVIRNYRQAIGIGINAPVCFWCNKHITMEQPFKERDNKKVHYRCATAFDKQDQHESDPVDGMV